jgi:hypothetical protein
MKIKIIPLLLSSLLLGSCEDQLSPISIQSSENNIDIRADHSHSNKSREEIYADIEKNLKVIGESLLYLSNDKKFLKAFARESMKMRDGENNVLFNYLVSESKKGDLDLDLVSELKSKLEKNKKGDLDNALNAFYDINGVIYFPHIYIPSFNKFYDASGTKIKEKNGPTLVVYAGDEKKTVYEGYILNENDSIISIGEIVDEEYSKKNEVWVVALNETYTQSTNRDMQGTQGIEVYYDEPIEEPGDGSGGGYTPPPSTNTVLCKDYGTNSVPPKEGVDIIIHKVRLKRHFESWIAGASELIIVPTSIWSNNINYYTKKVIT